jgi:release factor glutamine methyltransferase
MLSEAGVESAALDARLLLAAASGLDAARLIGLARESVPPLAQSAFDAYLSRRLKGEPVARILGRKEFWSLPLDLNAATLVPRPETETLVEAVLAEIRGRFPPKISICDLGTGSGAILIALLSELPAARGVATDISEEALAVARRNAERTGVLPRIEFCRTSFTHGPDGPFDVVVANPPYIMSSAIDDLAPEVRNHDPRAALDGGEDGLDAYRAILARSGVLLAKDGLLAFEVGHEQGEVVAALCRDSGLSDVRIRSDLAGADRVVMATAPSTPDGGKAAKKRLEKSESRDNLVLQTR